MMSDVPSIKNQIVLENKYELIELISRAIREAEAWNNTSKRLGEAHKYVQDFCMPDGWGHNVWHSILDDAIKLRKKVKELEQHCTEHGI